MVRAFVTGIAGLALGDNERRFVAEADPFGLILFRRNVDSPDQLRRLTDAFRAAVGRDAPVLVDQEGGRVQRLSVPHWRRYPSARRLAAAAAGDAALVGDVARLMAADLRAVGITIDCAPSLDVETPGMTEAIGDRSFGGDAAAVTAAAGAFARGLLDGGILPVIKHIPGHGRALVDSHLGLPVVAADIELLQATDFAPFYALADLPAAMTAHLLYTAIDPERPATLSPAVIGGIVRDLIGFDGLLFSDDLSMKALSGSLGARAAGTIAAGCDIALHCSGDMAEMEEVAAAVPELAGKSAERAEKALKAPGDPSHIDADRIVARLAAALAAHDDASGI